MSAIRSAKNASSQQIFIETISRLASAVCSHIRGKDPRKTHCALRKNSSLLEVKSVMAGPSVSFKVK